MDSRCRCGVDVVEPESEYLCAVTPVLDIVCTPEVDIVNVHSCTINTWETQNCCLSLQLFTGGKRILAAPSVVHNQFDLGIFVFYDKV